MSALFRPEAVTHARGRLSGEVVLVAPLPLRLLGLFLAAVVLAALTFAAWATYARKASVTGWLVGESKKAKRRKKKRHKQECRC